MVKLYLKPTKARFFLTSYEKLQLGATTCGESRESLPEQEHHFTDLLPYIPPYKLECLLTLELLVRIIRMQYSSNQRHRGSGTA